jgi:hypothetical protein
MQNGEETQASFERGGIDRRWLFVKMSLMGFAWKSVVCQMCGQLYHELCIGAEAVHLWTVAVTGTDGSYPAFFW